MLRKLGSTTALSAAFLTAAAVTVAPAQADPANPVDDAFLNAVTEAGVVMGDPSSAVSLGQQVCPMLSEPGQTAADVAAKVADTGGMSLGPATMFTGIAVSMFCPTVMSSIGSGQSPIPLSLFGL
ncbi:DUF732 domain-containing protein [Mycobacterium deserti]|uniref:DUF732 domain-containing protein n=1 Tax=Mycobacterium deserti TaxID=2978347 RepID=A0ABT2MIB3_9MYCO|nr:DUF732 domain-containing protein [Mycobacterium deserti]MCT7662023.1 DUF732 domain-containing protein [Mycobacterium deserti]